MLGRHFAGILDPIHKISAALSSLGTAGITHRIRTARPLAPLGLGALGRDPPGPANSFSGRLRPGLSMSSRARPGLLAGRAAAEQQFTSLAGLAEKMQQEAARQDAARQHLLAQQEANRHLGNLAGAAVARAQGAGRRHKPGQW